MNSQSTTDQSKAVKPCRKCGASDRYANGQCRPCSSERNRKFRASNPEYGTKWRERNLEKHKEQCRDWHKRNPEKSVMIRDSWKSKNKDRMKEREREWRSENPEKARARDQSRRRMRNSGDKLSDGIVIYLMEKQKGLCACCGEPLGNLYEIDHIMPLALGGKNVDENVQLLKRFCNRSKGAMHPIDYMRRKGRLL